MIDLLAIGANSLIARHVCQWATGRGWTAQDLSGTRDCAEAIGQFRPRWLVHTAGGPSDAEWIRESITGLLRSADQVGARCCLVSSDVVFSGQRIGRYSVHARPDPIHPYGVAKAYAEQIVLARPSGLVVRTSLTVTHLLDGPQEALVRRAIEGDRSIVFYDDEVRCPLDVEDLATAIGDLLTTESSGIRHVVGPQPLSRSELALLIADALGHTSAGIARGRSDGSRPRRVELEPSTLRTPVRPVDRSWVQRARAGR